MAGTVLCSAPKLEIDDSLENISPATLRDAITTISVLFNIEAENWLFQALSCTGAQPNTILNVMVLRD